ncbi:MAG: ABC transporter ATP-binding protein [Candidatus Methanomethylophilaceae archaeon]|nr:ABC transporter ATP-binding protein [Candidatus Methanomethylophilaceae archaeon]
MILRYLGRREWFLVALCVAAVVVQVFLDLRIPEYMSSITEKIQLGMPSDIIAEEGVRMLACAFLGLLASLAAGALAANIAASLARNLRRLQFEGVQSFSREDMDSFSASSLITRSTNDVYNLMQFIARGLVIIVKAPLISVWAVVKISGGSFEWTLATGVAVIALVVILFLLLSRNMPYARRIQWLIDGINRSTRENVEGARVIRAYNAEGLQNAKFTRANDELLQNNVRSSLILSPLHPVSSSMLNFLTLAIYWIGAGLIMSSPDHMDKVVLFSDMIVFSSYAGQVITSIMMLSGIVKGMPRAMVSASRIEEVVSHRPSVADGSARTGPTGAGCSVRFEDVSFTYPCCTSPVLSGVSFSVGPGETFAVVGPTGSGKSTVAALVTRMYDASSGSVLVDGTDVRDYRQDDLHSRMGYVPQRAVIFSGSVRYNVAYGEGSDPSDASVRRALSIAQALDFVEAMPEGLDSHISQHGRNVSGGQKQRICIARAVCRSPDLYIFDDTFSALDSRTDRMLRETLRRETTGSTTIIVSQKISSIADADRIMVLDMGRVVGMGTHEELLASCDVYRDMAESQMAGGDL